MSSFRGIIGLFPWRQWPPIRCKVKRLKSEVRAVCLLKHRKPQTADSSAFECVLLHSNVLFSSSSSTFWCRTLNGINTVPRLHLIFPWRLKNLSSGFKWLGMQVCFSSLIFFQKVLHLFVLYVSEKSKRQKLQHIATKKIIYCANFQGMEFWLKNGRIDFSALVLLWR